MPREISVGSNTRDLEQRRSRPGMRFMCVLGSRSFLDVWLDRRDLEWYWFALVDVDGESVDVDVENADVVVVVTSPLALALVGMDDDDEKELEAPLLLVLLTTTAQSCNSRSPCSSKSVEKRCCLVLMLSLGLS